jgi:Fe-S-cluster containining protein
MLKEILSPKTCEKCRGCCYFDDDDLWEVPTVTPELAGYIEKNFPEIKLKSKENNAVYYFDMVDTISDEDDKIYICNALSENGCILGENKPFDCRIWPFRLMKNKENEVKIAVSKYCEAVSSISVERLENFLIESGLIEKIKKYKDENKYAIKEYSNDYIFLNVI